MTATLFGHSSSAVISACGLYRYSLTRRWDQNLPRICWIMLNPSTADADTDDNTLKQVRWFSRIRGYGSLEVVNLFALRSTNPGALRLHEDPIGPENDGYIDRAVARADRVMVAWGKDGRLFGRSGEVIARVGECYCLRITKGGEPWHPLYVPHSTMPVRYERSWVRERGDTRR